MEEEKMFCGWETCGAILYPIAGKKFVKCFKCGHMNCPSCRASHEGLNCAKYKAQRQSVPSTSRSPSTGDRSPIGGSFSPGATANKGGSAKMGGPFSPSKSSSPSFEGACQSPMATYAPSTSAVTPKAPPPVQNPSSDADQARQLPAAGGPKVLAICAAEDCGYEKLVDASATELPCYKCRHTTCLRCKAIHGTLTCEQYQNQVCLPSQFPDEEDEIQAECAKPGCPFVAYVGVSMQQLICPLCQQITCLKCNAAHEFKTCEEYEKQRRRSSGAQVALARDNNSVGAAQAVPNARSRPCAESASTQRPPAAVAAAKAAMEREASRLQESLAGHVSDEVRLVKSEVSANPTRPVFSEPRAVDEATAKTTGLMMECCACMVEAPLNELVEVAPCAHCLCRECVRAAGVSSLTYVVHCPVKPEEGGHCQSQIQESALRSVMSQQEYSRHKELLSFPVVQCPAEGCGGKFCIRPGVETLECSLCQTEYCVSCSANHPGRTCQEFINSIIDVGAIRLQDEVWQSGTTSSAASALSSEAELECSACLADIPIEEIANIEGCGHFLCRNCIREAKANSSAERIRCPVIEEDDTACQYYIQEAALQTSTRVLISTTGEETTSSGRPPTSLTVECSLCLAETPYGEIVELLWCGHLLCRDCVQRTAVNSTTYFVHCPVTPDGGVPCNSYIQESALETVLTAEEQERRKMLAEQSSSTDLWHTLLED